MKRRIFYKFHPGRNPSKIRRFIPIYDPQVPVILNEVTELARERNEGSL
jgi:hypothetical protein